MPHQPTDQPLCVMHAMVLCDHPDRTGGNDYVRCTACGFEWDYRKGCNPRGLALDAYAVALLAHAQQRIKELEATNTRLRLSWREDVDAAQQHAGAIAVERNQLHDRSVQLGSNLDALSRTVDEQAATIERLKAERDKANKTNPVQRMHNLVDGLGACDVCQQEPRSDDDYNSLCAACLQRLKAAEAALSAERAQTTWQPIETAPKDGTKVLIYARWNGGVELAVAEWGPDAASDGTPGWRAGYATTYLPAVVFAWMPLPSPPQEPTA